MSKSLVNLTNQLVTQEIERVLETYPHHPYQEIFANPDFRQNLIVYVLNRIPNYYVSVSQEEQALISGDYLHQYLGYLSQIEAIIRQGIEDILREESEAIRLHIPEITNPALMASDWFG
ncbi:late competence development ComFB family protein [Fortiea contorta]|uniref:late competence development ComFB family protein n=1 Tax=Fortiea contorta TaxID=1892405 RepID=UPI00034500E7|nr:late competence development ComFB family protein [Fortiea contorta]